MSTVAESESELPESSRLGPEMKTFISVIIAFAIVVSLCLGGLYKFALERARMDWTYALVSDLSAYYRSTKRFPANWDEFVKWTSSGNSPRKWDAEDLSGRFKLNSNDQPVLTVLDTNIKPLEDDINRRLMDEKRIDLQFGAAAGHKVDFHEHN